jgi:glycine cleavage system pyridoxal-binding protein P
LAHLAIEDELEPPVSTSRSIFARNTFRDFMEKMGVSSIEELNVDDFPEMMKLREKAISHRQKQEESKITSMYKQK